MNADLQILLIAVVTAVAAALPGAFLVLRRMAMVSDAISHSILPGIVVAFFIVRDLSSPLLILAAAATGVITVALIEVIHRTGKVAEDTAIGLVFPALFSLGVILISRYAGGIHLDTDSVLLGKLEFAPFDRLVLAGTDLGPVSLWTMCVVLTLNVAFIVVFHKELKLATVDKGLAALLGFSPVLLHYALMTLVSVTAVGAFNAVGSILVIALMIAPPATAYLVANRLGPMLVLSGVFGAVSATAGWAGAYWLDTSIAGSMATACGLLFMFGLLFAPKRGLWPQLRTQKAQRLSLAVRMLVVHIAHHENSPEAAEECRQDQLDRHLRWSSALIRQVVRQAKTIDLIEDNEGLLMLTDSGRELANTALSVDRPLLDPLAG